MKPKLMPYRSMPLRARLTLVYSALFLIAGVVLLGATYALFNQQLSRGGVRFLAQGPGPSPGSSASASPAPGSPASPAPAPGRTFVIPQDGQKLTGVFPDDGKMLTGSEAEKWMKDQRDKLHDAANTSLITQGAIALVLVGGLAAGLGWIIAGRVLAPLHQVTDTARRIASAPVASRGLHERIALRGPDDEVKELADTFDTMVERLDRSFDGQRRFVANASHELRTPLTLGRALVEVAMHRRLASEDVKQLGESLLEINSRHERLITGLLLLAGLENQITDRAPVDLADVVGHVAGQTTPEAKQAGILLSEEPGEALTAGDALLLERLVQNLVENGIRHNTGPGGWVKVATRAQDDDQVEVHVSNSGPLVPHYEIPALFEPFRRLGTERLVTAKGAGLGLSIVRSIAHAHGGEVTAHPRQDGGLDVTVTLPAEAV